MRLPLFLLGFVAAFAVACGAGGEDPSDPGPGAVSSPDLRGSEITIYAGRAEALVGPLVKQFEEATGIKANVKYAGSPELAATLLEEGSRSPADVFWSQDPGPLGAVAGMLARLPEPTVEKVDPRFKAADGTWVGVSGRARVVVYNTDRLTPADLPASILEFTDPKWKGRIGWAPTNASLQAMVTTIRQVQGEEAAKRWLEGIRANDAKVYPNNTSVVEAVGKGEVDVGFVNHYYLYAIRKSNPDIKAENYHLKNGDPGAVVFAAGAAILSTSKNKAGAQRFVDYLLTQEAQKYFAEQTFEYPLTPGVVVDARLVPLAQIQSPNIDLSNLRELEGTLKLMREARVIE